MQRIQELLIILSTKFLTLERTTQTILPEVQRILQDGQNNGKVSRKVLTVRPTDVNE